MSSFKKTKVTSLCTQPKQLLSYFRRTHGRFGNRKSLSHRASKAFSVCAAPGPKGERKVAQNREKRKIGEGAVKAAKFWQRVMKQPTTFASTTNRPTDHVCSYALLRCIHTQSAVRCRRRRRQRALSNYTPPPPPLLLQSLCILQFKTPALSPPPLASPHGSEKTGLHVHDQIDANLRGFKQK